MKYIFPRQSGLHNVFTSKVDYRDTAQPFKDYTLREQEIARVRHEQYVKSGAREDVDSFKTNIPKRLRAQALELVGKLRALHQACSYTELLRYYCPVKTLPAIAAKPNRVDSSASAKVTEESSVKLASAHDLCFTDLACPVSDVSAFCRAVLSKVVPKVFWGEGPTRSWNMRVFMRHVDRFVVLRKFESLTLHEVMQDLKIADITWLQPPKATATSKMSQSDFLKRRELLMEFVYYLLDSFLIPLIRSNFHVTESNVHKNRLFYFRHDVWRTLAEPSLTILKPSMFEEMKTENAQKLLAKRSLGYSHIRLLPKGTGMRPITNLRRRVQVRRGGNVILRRSINSVMAPTFNVLNYEKSAQPARLGSSLFSIGDIFPKLRAFRSSLQARGLADRPLFLAKLDVQSCFDTIPQQQLIQLLQNLLSANDYRVSRHAEVRPPQIQHDRAGAFLSARPLIKFVAHGRAAGKLLPFEQLMRQEFATGKKGTVFVDSVVQSVQHKEEVLGLLREHVERNIVKIGKKFYRQKQGVPQGSVVSTLLCNFFYARLEDQCLGFLRKADCLLLRLIDDFLLITLHRVDAERFVQVMYEGVPEFGVSVKKQKALVNFDVEVQGIGVMKQPEAATFPYCGISIDTATLDVSRVPDRKTTSNVCDALTVDITAVPGQTFHRKALNALKIRMHKMFFDTAFNALPTVLTNLYHTFHESALRCYGYLKSLPPNRQPPPRLLIKTVAELVALALAMMKRRTASKKGWAGYECTVGKRQTKWLACKAFQDVFQRRQTRFAVLLAWLEDGLLAAWPTSRVERGLMEGAAGG
ncbi:Telomerase reverse transcriptase [Coniosporium apollinis]|uniref:Telomerase reverse transcriptase n=1 Tax=Coniosporium apollinis TaxID=61459 RepID=A0ABQ9NTB6_9PEZI|nr:Telomerase reverse transcriptase [Coniosporium apollinis]